MLASKHRFHEKRSTILNHRASGIHLQQDSPWVRATRLLGCVTVVLPAYNAGSAVTLTVSIVSRVLEETMIPRYEVIVVDDGSTDDTAKHASNAPIGPRGTLEVLRLKHNHGKGAALAVGIYKSQCPYIAFLDADGDIHPLQLLYILAPLHVYDVVVTSKWHPQSITRASRLRRLLSHGYKSLVWLATGLRLWDTQTGAKAFRATVLRQALRYVYARRYSFDTELLAVLHRLGARMLEVPSIAPLSLHGRQKPSTIAQMFLELLVIAYRLRAWKH